MTSWRGDPDLQGRFHPQYPDDLQVIVHDGEPRRTKRSPEACWVRVTGVAGTLRLPSAPPDTPPPTPAHLIRWADVTVYAATVLNVPEQLATVREGSSITFVHAPGLPHPLQVTSEYLRERAQWCVAPCTNCGANQALDPMTTMWRTRFPDSPGMTPLAFSAICPCGGRMMLSMVQE
jgi:hypothetical protein